MTASYRKRIKGRPSQGHEDDCHLLQRVCCRIVFCTVHGLLFCLLGVIPTAKQAAGEVRSVSRVYHSACLERGQSYWDYENFQLNSVDWEDSDRYEVTGRLGFGRFSEVLEGVTTDHRQRKVVLKVLKPARPYKIKREIRVLQLLAGGPNVLSLEGVCRDRTTGTTTLVLEHLGDGAQWLGHTNLSGAASTAAGAALHAAGGGGEGGRHPGGTGGGSGAAGAAGSAVWSSRTLASSGANGGSNIGQSVDAGTNGPEVATDRDAGRDPGLQRGRGRARTGLKTNQEGLGDGNDGTPSDSDVNGGGLVDKGRLTDYEVRLYLYKLLQALDFAHSRGLMHRDVKPRNVVINRRTRQLRLIDWGLGDFYIPGRRNMARVGSRYYKAPELLVGFRFYDYAVDIFSVGCMLAGFLLNREPFFRGKDNEDQLVRIALVLGTQGLHDFLRKYDVTLEPKLLEMLGTHRKKAWGTLGGGGGGGDGHVACSAEGLDLLDRMLCYDHQELHQFVYQHKAGKSVELMLVDAFVAADPYFSVPGRVDEQHPDGRWKISEAIFDCRAFTNLKVFVRDPDKMDAARRALDLFCRECGCASPCPLLSQGDVGES